MSRAGGRLVANAELPIALVSKRLEFDSFQRVSPALSIRHLRLTTFYYRAIELSDYLLLLYTELPVILVYVLLLAWISKGSSCLSSWLYVFVTFFSKVGCLHKITPAVLPRLEGVVSTYGFVIFYFHLLDSRSVFATKVWSFLSLQSGLYFLS